MSPALLAALDGLSVALAYPTAGTRDAVVDCRARLVEVNPDAAAAIDAFCQAIADLDDDALEELYTRTFDLNPVCALEVGWHIYGEQYRRGRFLVQARDLLRRTGIAEGKELPDHLMSLLPAVARLDAEDAARFAGIYLVPAVDKMLQGFDGRESPYAEILIAVRRVLEMFASDTVSVSGPFEDEDLVRIGTPQRSFVPKGAIS